MTYYIKFDLILQVSKQEPSISLKFSWMIEILKKLLYFEQWHTSYISQINVIKDLEVVCILYVPMYSMYPTHPTPPTHCFTPKSILIFNKLSWMSHYHLPRRPHLSSPKSGTLNVLQVPWVLAILEDFMTKKNWMKLKHTNFINHLRRPPGTYPESFVKFWHHLVEILSGITW